MAIIDERYVRLETFKSNGDAAATPVWIAELEGRPVVITDRDSFKAKRLRRDQRIRLTPCNVNGKRTLGETLEGKGRVVEDPAFVERARRAIRAKYGLQARLIELFKRLRGAQDTWCALELQL